MIALTGLVLPSSGAAGATAGGVVTPFVGAERPVSHVVTGVPHEGSDPQIAFGGSVYLAVWVDHAWTGGGRQISATRISRAGEVLDRSAISVSFGEHSESPSVAFDGTNFLVTWIAGNDVHARRMSPAGGLLDSSPIVVSSGLGGRPRVAFGGTDYLVVWPAFEPGPPEDATIRGRRVRSDGTLSGLRRFQLPGDVG